MNGLEGHCRVGDPPSQDPQSGSPAHSSDGACPGDHGQGPAWSLAPSPVASANLLLFLSLFLLGKAGVSIAPSKHSLRTKDSPRRWAGPRPPTGLWGPWGSGQASSVRAAGNGQVTRILAVDLDQHPSPHRCWSILPDSPHDQSCSPKCRPNNPKQSQPGHSLAAQSCQVFQPHWGP